jgi:hypothetical protein
MFNDTLQGKAEGLAIILGGTPQFLEDTRRGLFSYEALKSRLCDSRYADMGYRNLLNPVIRLRRLSDNELLALIARISALFDEYHGVSSPVTEEEMSGFLSMNLERAGADTMITPREIIRDYIAVLNILLQNKDVTFAEVIKRNSTQAPAKEETSAEKVTPVSTQTKFTPEDIEF